MRSAFAAGVAMAWLGTAAKLAVVVAASPWFLDSLGWLAVGLALATLAGGAFGVLLLPFRRTRAIEAIARRAGRIVAIAAVVVLGLFAYSTARSYVVRDDRPKVLVLGLDGATYDIIDPLVAAGKLPNLARLMQGGARAELISVDPTISPAVWTEMATGKVRAKNGVINFRSIQSMLQAKRFWDIAHDAGKTIGMLDWLVSWPPLIDDDGKSFWVPDHTARGPEAVPKRLEFLQALVGATRNDRAVTLADRATWAVDAVLSGLRLSTLGTAAVTVVQIGASKANDLDKMWRLQRVALALYRDLFLALRAEYRPELAAVTFYGTDSLSHKYWRYFDPTHFPDTTPEDVARYGRVLTDYYEAADAALGEILATVDEQTTVLVVSDHGSQAIDGGEELRFPRLRGDALANLLGIAGAVDVTGIGNEIVITQKADAALDATVLPKTARRLQGARLDGFDAEPFVVDFIDREGDSGDYVGVAFNLAVHLTGADAFEKTLRFTDGTAIELADLVATDFSISGGHHVRGIVIASGLGARAGTRFEGASLLDVAPTVLWLLGLPVGADMDGKVLVDAFDPAWVAARPIETVASYGGFGDALATGGEGEMTPALKERLKSLGYLSE